MLKEQTKKEKVMLTLAVILTVIGMANAIRVLIMDRVDLPAVGSVVEYALIIIYATVGFKKPHGNLLKILTLTFAFIVAFLAIDSFQEDILTAVLSSATVVLIAFMAGRLDRFKQNKVLALIILALLLAVSVKSVITVGQETGEPAPMEMVAGMIENGEQPPEIPDGEPPVLAEGEVPPEKPDGEPPVLADGEVPPEKPEGAPVLEDGTVPPEVPAGVTVSYISLFNLVIMWIALFFGYCARFRRHKEAGLADAPKKEA